MSQPCCYHCEACLSPLPPAADASEKQQQQAATPCSSSNATSTTSTSTSSSHPPAQAPLLLPSSLVPAGMEESFILLAGEASQLYVGRGDRRFGATAAAGSSSSTTAANSATAPPKYKKKNVIPRTPLHAHFRSLAAAFEVSASVAASSGKGSNSSSGGVPSSSSTSSPRMFLCSDCASRVAAELDAEAEAALEDARAAEEALSVLRAEAEEEEEARSSPTPSLEVARARAAAAKKRALDAAASLENATLDAARAAADARAVSALEARYWLELDAALSSAAASAEDAAATLARAERAAALLESLRSRDAVCDLHRIWYHDERVDGRGGSGSGGEGQLCSSYATVAGCRAGKGAGLGWDEANAALGSAARLLATLFRMHCAGDDDEEEEEEERNRDQRRRQRRRRFLSSASKVRLLPAGSTARISDARTGSVHDLFGPVNKLYCASFDKGMSLMAVGVREFALAATESDRRRALEAEGAEEEDKGKKNPSPEEEREAQGEIDVFSLPYEITPDGDRVGGLSLRLMLNKDARWTRAVKYLMADLKCCAAWSATERARWRREEVEGRERARVRRGGRVEEGEETTAPEAAPAATASTTA